MDPSSWAADWLFRLLSKELSLPCLLRLWDTYFSEPEGLELHPYVCLAVLKFFSDQLDDLEHSEILAFVRCLPSMDMDEVRPGHLFEKKNSKPKINQILPISLQIITEAANLKEEISAQGI